MYAWQINLGFSNSNNPWHLWLGITHTYAISLLCADAAMVSVLTPSAFDTARAGEATAPCKLLAVVANGCHLRLGTTGAGALSS